ncbi:hypothetical protein GCM10008924_19130 [Gracilibacillus halotolerans]
MGYLKGKSSVIDSQANLKYKYGNHKFWCSGFYINTVIRNKKKIQEYIRYQLKEVYMTDQLTIFEEFDPFTGQ